MNKNNNKKLYLIIGIIIILFSIATIIIINSIESKEEKIEPYTMTYHINAIPGSKKEIKVFENKIEVSTTQYCSSPDCKPETTTETLNYSKNNIKKFNEFVKKNFKDEKIDVSESDLTTYQNEVMQGLLLSEKLFELNIEEYKYKIEYYKNNHSSYTIYYKNDYSILVKKSSINEDYDITNIETYKLNFKKENIDILFNYVQDEIKFENEETNIILKYSTLLKYENNIFKSITENNESYLKNEAKLLYSINYNGIDCPTPTLYLYEDNTYEYFYTMSTDDEKLIPKTGSYNYDISKLISNINNYEDNDIGPYYIKAYNGESYTTYNTNKELQDLLKELNIQLEKCLEQQKNP